MRKTFAFLLVACLAFAAGCTDQGSSSQSGDASLFTWIEDKGARDLADYEDYELVVYYDASAQKCGFADLFGNIVVAAEFDEAYPFNQGLARVGQHEGFLKCKYTYIDKNGNLIKDYTWDIAYEFSPFGVAAVGVGEISVEGTLHFEGKYGLIDKSGEYVSPLVWEGDLSALDARVSGEGLIPMGVPQLAYTSMHQDAETGEGSNTGEAPLFYRLGYADYKGDVAILPAWRYAEGFKNGLAVVSREDMLSYQFLFDDYDSADPDAIFTGRYSIIDTKGEAIMDITRDLLHETGKFHAWVYVIGGEYVMVDLFEPGGGLGNHIKTIYLDLDGNIIPEADFEYSGINFWRGNTICVDETTGKYGVHSNGKLIVAPIFDELTNPNSAFAALPTYAKYNGSVNAYYAKLGDQEGYIYVKGAN
ncbi:MAG: WG repeat-containing protein [Clostridiales bacterium]|nr:WG repeat-containing protein [Clostridiales bacterium]